MKLRHSIFTVLVCLSAASFSSSVAQDAQFSSDEQMEMVLGEFQKYMMMIQKNLSELSKSFTHNINDIKVDIASVVVLEGLYALCTNTGAWPKDTSWWYVIKSWEVWAAFSALQSLGMAYDDLYQMSDLLQDRNKIMSHLRSLEAGQGLLDDFDADYSSAVEA